MMNWRRGVRERDTSGGGAQWVAGLGGTQKRRAAALALRPSRLSVEVPFDLPGLHACRVKRHIHPKRVGLGFRPISAPCRAFCAFSQAHTGDVFGPFTSTFSITVKSTPLRVRACACETSQTALQYTRPAEVLQASDAPLPPPPLPPPATGATTQQTAITLSLVNLQIWSGEPLSWAPNWECPCASATQQRKRTSHSSPALCKTPGCTGTPAGCEGGRHATDLARGTHTRGAAHQDLEALRSVLPARARERERGRELERVQVGSV